MGGGGIILGDNSVCPCFEKGVDFNEFFKISFQLKTCSAGYTFVKIFLKALRDFKSY